MKIQIVIIKILIFLFKIIKFESDRMIHMIHHTPPYTTIQPPRHPDHRTPPSTLHPPLSTQHWTSVLAREVFKGSTVPVLDYYQVGSHGYHMGCFHPRSYSSTALNDPSHHAAAPTNLTTQFLSHRGDLHSRWGMFGPSTLSQEERLWDCTHWLFSPTPPHRPIAPPPHDPTAPLAHRPKRPGTALNAPGVGTLKCGVECFI